MMPIRTNKFRPFDRIEVTDEPIIGNAGLAAVARRLKLRQVSLEIDLKIPSGCALSRAKSNTKIHSKLRAVESKMSPVMPAASQRF
jgi:hypothetical protein